MLLIPVCYITVSLIFTPIEVSEKKIFSGVLKLFFPQHDNAKIYLFFKSKKICTYNIYIEKNLVSITTENHNFRFNPLRWNFYSSIENEDIFIRGKMHLFHFNLNFPISSRIQIPRFHTSLLRMQTTINECGKSPFENRLKNNTRFIWNYSHNVSGIYHWLRTKETLLEKTTEEGSMF